MFCIRFPRLFIPSSLAYCFSLRNNAAGRLRTMALYGRSLSTDTKKHGGILRIRIEDSPQFVGIRSTRGTREFNEDRYQRLSIRLAEKEAVYIAVFDGHGGSRASDYCAANLHLQIERHYASIYKENDQPSLNLTSSSDIRHQQQMVEESLKRAFHEVDQMFLESHDREGLEGTTASVAIIQALDSIPFISQQDARSVPVRQGILAIGHVGDSRILLCDNVTGRAQQLTIDHNPSLASEMERIQGSGGFVSEDAFGELALMGMACNSRSIGVARLKRWDNERGCGLIATPWTQCRIVDTKDAFLVLLTDGVTHVMDNQEVVDVVKHCRDPKSAAVAIVNVSEQFGADDNTTAVVVRLAGWPMHSTPTGTRDFTQNLRRFKANNVLSKMEHDFHAELDESVSADRLVIELFDAIGKDIGSSSFIPEPDYTETAARRPLGRLMEDEMLSGLRSLNLLFQKPNDLNLITAGEIVRQIYDTLDIRPDFERGEGLALSAADILKSLKQMNVRILRRSQLP